MASKEVLKIAGLKLTVEGAAQFQSSLKNINSQMKISSAELQKVTAQYGKNSTATGALTSKKKALEDKLKTQRDATARLNDVLRETEERYGKNSTEANTMRAKVLESEAAEKRLQSQLKAVSLELAKQASKAVQLGQKLQAAGAKMQAFGKKASAVGSSMTRYVTVPLLAAGAAAVKTAIDFETAFTGVRKTVDGTEEQLAELKQGILDMTSEVPASAEAIAAVAEAAGQLGIETDSILGFTRVMIDLGETTNLSSEEASTALARFANITQMSQDDFDKLGSVIVDLGNNMATTEAEIVALGMRLAGAGSQIGLTEAEIMGFAAALSSVGIEAEAGGSAFSKVMVNMQLATEKGGKKLKDFASVAGMSADEFKKKFQTDASGAIIAFIEGLGNLEGSGKTAIGVLDEMGITEVRLRDTLLRAAGAGDLLTEAVTTGTDAWGDNNALTTEANKRYEDTAAQMKIAWNEIRKMAMEFGNALLPTIRDVIKDLKPLVKWFSDLDETTKKNIIKAAAFVAALGPVIKIIGKTSHGIGTLTKGAGKLIEKFGASRAAASVASAGLGGVSSAATGAGAAAAGATTATGGLTAAFVGAAAASVGIVAAAVAIGTAIDNSRTTTEEFETATQQAFDSFASAVESANGVMEIFVSDTTATGEAVETVKEKINTVEGQIVAAYKAYMAEKGVERDKELANIRKFNEELRLLMLDEMSAYGTAQQVLADQLRLGTIEVTKENMADVVKSIGDAETQAKDAAESIYQEQARYVTLNKDLTQAQKDDQLQKLAETRDEGVRIAAQMAADSAYYAQLQLVSGNKNLSKQLATVKNYGKKMTDSNKEYAERRQEILDTEYGDTLTRDRLLKELAMEYAGHQRTYAQKISDAWLTVDDNTRAAWLNLVDAQTTGGRQLDKDSRTIVNNLMQMYGSMEGGMDEIGRDTMVSLGRAILNEKNPKRAATASKDECVEAFTNAYGEFEDAGTRGINAAAAGMKKGKPGLKDDAEWVKDGAVGEFRKLEGAAEEAGKDGIRGFSRGLRNRFLNWGVYRAAYDVGQTANDGLKDGIDARSDSKLWEKIGKWGPGGFIKGILSEEKRVMKAAQRFADAANAGLVSGVTVDGGTSTGGTGTTGTPTNIESMIHRGIEKTMSRVTVQLDRRQIGRLVVMAER